MKKALEFIILLLIYLALVTTPLALIVYAYLIENIWIGIIGIILFKIIFIGW